MTVYLIGAVASLLFYLVVLAPEVWRETRHNKLYTTASWAILSFALWPFMLAVVILILWSVLCDD